MLADPSFGQEVPKPIRHEHVVGRLPQARACEAIGTWRLGTGCAEMKVTAKLHGPLLGLHQDTTLADSVAFLWYLRHVIAMGGAFYTHTP